MTEADYDKIGKYLTGEASIAEREEVEQWVKASPENSRELETLKQAIRPSGKLPDFSASMQEDFEALRKRSERSRTLWNDKWWRVAAAVLMLAIAGLGTWLTVSDFSSAEQFASLDSVRTISLSDGTKVWLNRKSKLTLEKTFGEKSRNVVLEGEAYFEVAPDKSRPFSVETGSLTTVVVGTAFNVRREVSGIRVTVAEGKVRVNGNDQELFLTAGEKAIYTAGNLDKGTAVPNDLSWKTGIIRFENAPLQEVVKFLSEHYNVDIRLREENLGEYRITTVLDNLSAAMALEIVATTLDLELSQAEQVYYLERQR